MPKDNIPTDEQAQDEVMEKEQAAQPDPDLYTHRLEKPFTYENKTVNELHFDFGTLTGADTLAIEAELNHRMKNLMYPHLSWEFMTLMAVRACTTRDGNGLRVVDEKLLKALPMRDYNRIVGAARNFLLGSGL